MADTIETKLIDKRTYERYLQNGRLDDKAYERHIKGLPDLADKAAPVETTMGEAAAAEEAEPAPEQGSEQ
jgi:hypothetical protein